MSTIAANTPPLGFLRRLSDKAAIVFGHLAVLLLGLLTWGMEAANAPYRLVTLGKPEPGDYSSLIKYGLTGILVPLIAIYGLSWWIAKRDRITDFRTALASFCRLLWPAFFGLFIIPAAFLPIEERDTLGLLLLPVVGLMVIFLVWQFLAFRGNDRSEWLSSPEASFRTWGTAALALIAAYFAWFCILTIRRHVTINTGLHDAGMHDQMIWNTINGRPFEASSLRLEWAGYSLHLFDNHFFAEHFIPTFGILIPLYWLFPNMETILIVQTFMLAAAGAPAFLIAWKKLQNGPLAFLLTFALLAHPMVQQANMADIHADTFFPVFLFGAYAALLYRRHAIYWFMVLLALGCKQEISINVALMGIFIFLTEKEHRKLAVGTFAIGAAWYILTLYVIIPHYRDGLPMRHFNRYGHFVPEWKWGSDLILTPGLILRRMIEHPAHAAGIIFDSTRFRSVVFIVAPFFFFMLFNRWAWLWLLPVAALHVLAGPSNQHGLESYYGITLMPAAFIGSVYGAQYLFRRRLGEGEPIPPGRIVAACVGMIFVLYWIWNVYGYGPFGGRFDTDDYRSHPHEDLIREYLKEIPDNANVTAQSRLGAQLAERRYIYNFPEVVTGEEGETEYIFLDTRGPAWPFVLWETHFQQHVQQYVESEEWGLVLPHEDGLLLFRRGHPPDEHRVAFEDLDFTRYRSGRP